MTLKDIALLVLSLCSGYVLWYAYYGSDFHFINWMVGAAFWLGVFSFILLIVRLLSRPSSSFYLMYSSVFVSVILAECLLRIFGVGATYHEKRDGFYVSLYTATEKGWFHTWSANSKHDLKQTEYNYPRKTNSLGLSDVEYQKDRKANSIRILAIGDSFTEGDGAPSDSTWPHRLCENLKGQYPARPIELFNAGVCGSDPFFSYIMLREKLIAYHPDLVILAMNSTDVNDVIIRGGMERFLQNNRTSYRPHPKFEFPLAISYVNRLVLKALAGLDETTCNTKQEQVQAETHAVAVLSQIVQKTSQLCKQNGGDFLLVAHPLNYECHAKSYMGIKPVLDNLKSNGDLAVFDFLNYLDQRHLIDGTATNSYYWEKDAHHNPKGYTLMGDAITLGVLPMISKRLDSLSHDISRRIDP